jgi:hypothetical protein
MMEPVGVDDDHGPAGRGDESGELARERRTQSCPRARQIQAHVEDLAARLAGRERCDAGARWRELMPACQTWPPASASPAAAI